METGVCLCDNCRMANKALKDARKAAGFTLETLSEAVGISTSQLSRFESGQRRPRAHEVTAIAAKLGVRAGEIWPDADVDVDASGTVPIVGFVTAGTDSIAFSDGQGPFDYVRAPAGANDNTVGVEVRGDSLGPLLNGATLFYDDYRSPLDPAWVGHICVCGLADGRVVVKAPQLGRTPGLWDLFANVGPAIYNAEVLWAARVREIRPPGS
jgi:transcriptional regulator with XRE-family HTH domain